MNKLMLLSVLLTGFAAHAHGQQALTPRDAFWSASDLLEIAPNPAAAAHANNQATVPEKTTQPPSPATQPKTATTVSKSASAQPKTAPAPKQKVVASKGYGAEPHIVKFSNPVQQPLGLRFALLKVGDAGELSEVLPETIFHSGDKVKISVMANQSGYIYIIQRGSSGSWRPLFPLQGAFPESNRVEAGRMYQVPDGKSFQFNQQTGNERLFILLSRQAVSDLDKVIFALQQQQNPAPSDGSTPGQVEANNRISDDLVQSLKSRDLAEVEDPPQETTSPSLGEKAIYVVSQGKGSGSPSQVFANLTLDHR